MKYHPKYPDHVALDMKLSPGPDVRIKLGWPKGKAHMCGLCPEDGTCLGPAMCTASDTEVWVPIHVAVAIRLHNAGGAHGH
jgi:hypothetical protein